MDRLFKECMSQTQDIVWTFCGLFIHQMKQREDNLTPDEVYELFFWDYFLKRTSNAVILLCFVKYGDSFPELFKTYLKTEYKFNHENEKIQQEFLDLVKMLK